MNRPKKFISFCRPAINQKEIKEVSKCLASGWLTMGQKVLDFETQFAKYLGVKYAIAVSSCTAALHLVLLAHHIQTGDEVIVPSFTFVSTVNVIEHVGAKPVFVDIDRHNLNIDPTKIEALITKKTKAIIVVHFGGCPANLEAVRTIANKYKLIVIEDAAHATGSKYQNRYIGSHGNSTCFSFYATKNLTTGEGGMITTNDEAIAEFTRQARLHGISKDAWKRYTKKGNYRYEVFFPGFKYNMTDLQAVMGMVQLKKLAKLNRKRERLAAYYYQKLKKIKNIELPDSLKVKGNSFHLFPLILKNTDRDELIAKMKDYQIGLSVHFLPVHQFSYYQKKYPQAGKHLKVTEEIGNKIISLPFHPLLKREDADYIIFALHKFINNTRL